MFIFLTYLLCAITISISCLYFINIYKQISGIDGLKGDNGSQGDKGPDGQIGSRGPKGTKGSKGPAGSPGGRRGLEGENGIQGYQGDRGLRGFRGFRGDKGDRGERGDRGFQGPEGAPGINGNTGDAGEYIYDLIDYDRCTIRNFDSSSREMMCGENEVMTEINNEIDNYFGKCCMIKISNECINKESNTPWKLEKDMSEREKESKRIFPMTARLYYNSDCESGYISKSQNEVFRCCLNNEESLNYSKNY